MPDDPRVDQLLEELLDSGGTPEEACRTCPELLAQVRAGWQRLRALKAEVDVMFHEFPFSSGAGPGPLPAVDLPQIRGYEVQEVLGRGGMGIVYKAWHLRLQRPIAVKMLLAGAYARPQELERFLREAEMVAGLRHANIVQVHEAGDVDGRPYFTMEIVEGGSLAQKLAGTPQPARQAAALVAVVASAVHAAHQRGIVHRDLKPGNILLTVDGTPKLTDFGVARRLEGAAGLTQSGAPLGTPSYMAPEQAEGRSRDVGPAADTYALGAILYELLTGRPPFRAETAAETLRQVIAHDPVPPSRLNAAVPRDLETICLKCLHKEPPRRYASAAALAEDLQRYGRGEPIAARPAGRLERLARWVRRHPAAAGLLAALAVLVAVAGTGALLLYQQRLAARARQDETDQNLLAILGRERDLLEKAWRAHDLAKLTETRDGGIRAADLARGGASAAVQQEAEMFRDNAALRLLRAHKNRALLEAMLDVTTPRETGDHVNYGSGHMVLRAQPGVDEQYAAAFRRWGLDVDDTPEDEVVARLGQEPDVVVQEVIAGLDAWMMVRRQEKRREREWQHLYRVAEQLDRSDRHRRLRMWLVAGAPQQAGPVAGLVASGSPWLASWELARGNSWRQLRELRKDIDPRNETVLTVVLLARAFAAVGDAAAEEEVLHKAATVRPDQVVLLSALAKLLERQEPPRLGEAIGYYQAARGQRPSLGIALSSALARAGRGTQAEDVLQELALQQPENPSVYFYLGISLSGQRKYGKAEAACRRVIALKPDFAEAYNNLAAVLYRQGRYAEAEAAFLRAIALKPDFALAHHNLGTALVDQRKYGDAEAAAGKATALNPDFAEAYNTLGNALHGQGRHGEAEAAYRRAIALNPPDLAMTHHRLCIVLIDQRKFGDAEAAAGRVIALKPDYAEAYNTLGNALYGQGRHGEAEVAYRRAIALKPDYAEAYTNLGNVLDAQGNHGEAEAAHRRAIALKPDLAQACYNLGNALSAKTKWGEAEAAYRRAIALKPDYAEAYTNLGSVLNAQGKPGEAEAAHRRAVALQPELPEARFNLGFVLMRQARFDEAAAALNKALDLLPATHPSREWARQLRQHCQRFAILDARLPAILRGTEKPANAAEQLELAQLCALKKNYAAAARFFRDAFTAEPKRAEAVPEATRYNAACAAALAGCGQGKDAGGLDDKARAFWRQQALDWLRQDLTSWGKAIDGADARTNAQARQMLRHWKADGDLVGVRAKDALARLPDEERKQWKMLWLDVDALLRRVNQPE